jgi:hypothetical protein
LSQGANTRGLELSATDILKAQTIGQLAPGLRDAYTKKWEDAEEEIGRVGFSDLFGHVRMIFRKAKQQGSLLAEFREYVLKSLNPEHFLDEVLMPLSAAD